MVPNAIDFPTDGTNFVAVHTFQSGGYLDISATPVKNDQLLSAIRPPDNGRLVPMVESGVSISQFFDVTSEKKWMAN